MPAAIRWKRNRPIGFLLCLVCFVWVLTTLHSSLNSLNDLEGKSSIQLQAEILGLSERYVKQLARETKNTVDGPFAARLTGYDLKKTMAVLLEDLMGRMEKIEGKMSYMDGNNSKHQVDRLEELGSEQTKNKQPQERVGFHGLLLGAQEDCSVKPEDIPAFPDCDGKMRWMEDHWKSDLCYAEYGVDGSQCSIRVFLSEIENWCPLLPGRTKLIPNTTTKKEVHIAEMNFDLNALLKQLANPGSRPNYDWIRERVTSMWLSWVSAGKSIQQKFNMTGRPQKKILIHMGFLSKKSGFKMVENSDRGGPLGELVQWSDIISSLYMLGHQITVTSEYEQLTVILDKLPRASQQCQILEAMPMDMIFSDIVGLSQFKKKVKNGFGKFSCLLRVVDSFGTEPAYNFDVYAKANRLKTSWGMQNLDTRQFFTMFPHSPDNSFMGFVVENHLNRSERLPPKKNQAVVYGKAEFMWQGQESYLAEFQKKMEIHGTVYPTGGVESVVPKYIHNHGILSGPDLHRLLQQSKLFIGLGFPYEGPAPLEAIAHGCVFINPKFIPPHNSHNTKFFQGKPTSRQVTSQHPYAEMFIGEPNVFTVDIDNKEQLRAVIDKALTHLNQNKVQGFMPYEFTQEGMLQRVSAYITHQDFCSPTAKRWPPVSEVTYHVAKAGQSCASACWERQLVCELSYFKSVNTKEDMERHYGQPCEVTSTRDNIYFPARRTDTQECILQSQPMLYSCVGEAKELQRLCPCRTFIKQQTALCKACL